MHAPEKHKKTGSNILHATVDRSNWELILSDEGWLIQTTPSKGNSWDLWNDMSSHYMKTTLQASILSTRSVCMEWKPWTCANFHIDEELSSSHITYSHRVDAQQKNDDRAFISVRFYMNVLYIRSREDEKMSTYWGTGRGLPRTTAAAGSPAWPRRRRTWRCRTSPGSCSS